MHTRPAPDLIAKRDPRYTLIMLRSHRGLDGSSHRFAAPCGYRRRRIKRGDRR
jgi:hypothetical protein